MCDLSRYLILSDLDGTFTGLHQERNIEAVRRFQQEGGLFSFSSGRVIHLMRKVFPPFDGLINAPALLCNGGCVYDPSTRSYLNVTPTDGRLLRPMVREVRKRFPSVDCVFFEGDYTFWDNVDPDSVPGNLWHKARFEADPETLLRVEALARAMGGPKLNYQYSSARYFEVFSSQFSKGSMMGFLRGWYAAKGRPLTVCAVGDYGNDIDMLQSADRAFCPSNAIPEVKERCEKVLCHHDEGAIAELIELLENENDNR